MFNQSRIIKVFQRIADNGETQLQYTGNLRQAVICQLRKIIMGKTHQQLGKYGRRTNFTVAILCIRAVNRIGKGLFCQQFIHYLRPFC